MKKIRYAVVGTGWRALFFIRAAKNLPERFEVTGVLTRTKERAQAFEREYGVRTFTDMDELLGTQPEFVVSCVTKKAIGGTTLELIRRGMNVLSETPIADTKEGLLEIYRAWKEAGVVLQLAEQYFLYPGHYARAAIADKGLLGRVNVCELSLVHDYHATSLMRRFMGDEDGEVQIHARTIASPIVLTGDRGGTIAGGPEETETRTLAQLVYADGRVGVYDFAGTQYHSVIRSNHLRVMGTRGEIFDDEVRWVRGDGRPAYAKLCYHRDEITGTIRAIDFDGERVYDNPFRWDVAMSEDDIAVSSILERMGKAVRTGELFYPMAHCLRDGQMTCLLHEAAAENGSRVLERMPWDD